MQLGIGRTVAASVLLALSAARAGAQNERVLAYPNDSVEFGGVNCAPFGWRTSGFCNQNRTQILIPARYMPPAGGKVVGLEITRCGTAGSTSCATGVPGLILYSTLQIDLESTLANTLDTTFANNVVAPTTVMNVNNQTLAFTANTWTRIPFTTTFQHPAGQGLVIDIVKDVSIGSPPANEVFHAHTGRERRDLPSMIYAANPFASQAVEGAPPIRMRLIIEDAPVLAVLSNQLGLFRNHFALGQPLTVRLDGQPTMPWATLLEVSNIAVPAPQPIPGLLGATHLDLLGGGAVPAISGFFPAAGRSSFNLTIPNAPVLFGQRLAFQGLAIDTAFGQIVWTTFADGWIRN